MADANNNIEPVNLGGRPSVYTPELVAALVAQLEINPTIKRACDAVGISTVTYYDWYNRSINNDPRFLGFSTAVDVARNALVNRSAKSVNGGVDADPYLALKVLERLDRETWGKQLTLDVNHSGTVEHSHHLNPPRVTTATPDQAKALQEMMQALLPPDTVDGEFTEVQQEPD